MRKEWIRALVLALVLISPWPIFVLTHPEEREGTTVAIPAEGPSLASPVSWIFSRSKYFVIVNVMTGNTRVIENPYADEAHGAGVRVAHLLLDEDVGVAIVRKHIGPEPYGNLRARGVRVFSGEARTVQEAVDLYRAGAMVKLTGPTVPAHYGL
jgi:predicted Fe-Mo cluster-binding NifX family protein